MKKNFSWEPLSIYQTFKIEPGTKKQKFTLGVNNTNIDYEEILYEYGEQELTRKFLNHGSQCSELFRKLGINYPNCWLGIDIHKDNLFPNWPHNKPGDIDIIAGNFKGNSQIIDPNSAVAIQVKVRKITSLDDLRSFPSGKGTIQSEKTVEMGFERVFLAHIIIREPRKLQEEHSTSWNAANNASFGRPIRACYGLIREELSRSEYGYIALGWGQAHGFDWRISGSYVSEVVKGAPIVNRLNPNQPILFKSLREIFDQPRNKVRPLIVDGVKDLD